MNVPDVFRLILRDMIQFVKKIKDTNTSVTLNEDFTLTLSKCFTVMRGVSH